MSKPERGVWERIPTHPDPSIHLGYDIQDLSVIRLNDLHDSYIVLPGDEEHLSKEEFIIASAGSICQLEDCR